MWAGYEGNDVLARMPNAVNWYRGSRKSDFVELRLPYLSTEEDRQDLIERLNAEFAPDLSSKPVYSLILKDGDLVPVAENAYPFAVQKNSVRWQNFIQQNYTIDQKLRPKVQNLIPIISPFFHAEPNVTIIAMPWLQSEIETEYVAKAGYMVAAYYNKWLIPYAHRVGWRFVNGNASLFLPYWTDTDVRAWYKVQFTEPIGTEQEGFILSDGKKYPYPTDIPIRIPNVITKQRNIFTLEGRSFDVTYVLEEDYPQTNRKEKSIARIANQIRQGLVPFDPPYPVVQLDDAEIRIQAKENKDLVIVYLVPNNIILGKHKKEHFTKALNLYRQLWKQGELLNDYGHFEYSDSYSELDERGIIFLHLSDTDL